MAKIIDTGAWSRTDAQIESALYGFNYINFLPRKEGTAAIKKYLQMEHGTAPSEAAQRREDRLKEIATRLLSELSKESR